MDIASDLPELLTVAEVALVLRATEDTIRLWCADGRLAGAFRRRSGRSHRWLIPKSQVLLKLEPVTPRCDLAGRGGVRPADERSWNELTEAERAKLKARRVEVRLSR